MANTNALITRTDWAQSASFSGGSWKAAAPLANMLTLRPQQFAEASTAASANTRFDCDLGATRKVGLIHFQGLITTQAATIRIQAGTDASFSTNAYDSTVVSAWPAEASPWGDGATLYSPAEYAALGCPRYFLPPSIIDCRYVRVLIVDTGADPPARIGYFGACEAWQFTYNMEYGWNVSVLDGAEVETVPYGSAFITPRFKRRRLNTIFSFMTEAEMLHRLLSISLIKGRSEPLVVVPFPAAGSDIEKLAIWGCFSQDPVFTNQEVVGGFYSAPLVIDQLV